MKSTEPITYLYEIDGREVALTRHHSHTAYPRNGNVGNPTVYFHWTCEVDGISVNTGMNCPQRAEAYEYARCHIQGLVYIPYRDYGAQRTRTRNVRSYTLVADEMKANYKGRRKVPA